MRVPGNTNVCSILTTTDHKAGKHLDWDKNVNDCERQSEWIARKLIPLVNASTDSKSASAALFPGT